MSSDHRESVTWIAEMIMSWQNAVGGIDVETCVFHQATPLGKPSAYGQDIPWLARALYRAYDATGRQEFRDAADRYSVYFVATMYSTAPTFAIGDALDPCLAQYRLHHPHEDSLDDKARTLVDWIEQRRTDNGNYFDVGYSWRDESGEFVEGSDAAFSNDLADVGRGLVWFAERFHDDSSLKQAEGLARYFTTDYTGTLDGVWSEEIGTWLIGPHPAKGFENVDEFANAVGWGWTNYYAAHYLMRLHDQTQDAELRDRIRHCCTRATAWAFDACQFEDGSLGMAGRDDKWLGMTGLGVILFQEIAQRGWTEGLDASYKRKAVAAYDFVVANATPDTFPTDGYVAVTGATRPEPAWNTSWMLGIILEALLAGADLALATVRQDTIGAA
jgi:hypothetical protein